jgi:hypothetical protein
MNTARKVDFGILKAICIRNDLNRANTTALQASTATATLISNAVYGHKRPPGVQ